MELGCKIQHPFLFYGKNGLEILNLLLSFKKGENIYLLGQYEGEQIITKLNVWLSYPFKSANRKK